MLNPVELAPQERLLVELSRRDEVRGGLADARALLEDPTSRGRLLHRAREHAVEGLVLSVLLRSPLARELSDATSRELLGSWNHLRRQAAVWDLERDRLLSRLSCAGLSPVLLKGAALRETLYAEPAERWLCDLDLLLPAGELDAARVALIEVGYSDIGGAELHEAYRRHHFHDRLEHPNGFVVELHWALSRPGAEPRLDERAFLTRATERLRPGGQALRVPSTEDMILHLASQNAEDTFGRLSRLVDLDRLVSAAPALDWAYLRETARTSGAKNFLALALRLAERLLETPIPPGFIESLADSPLTRLSLALLDPVPWALRSREHERNLTATALKFWVTAGWPRRLRRLTARPQLDPLAWVWLGHGGADGSGEGGRMASPFTPLLKLFGYQLWVYARGLLSVLTPSGRRRLRFWTTPRPPRLDPGPGG